MTTAEIKTYANFINGDWVESISGETYEMVADWAGHEDSLEWIVPDTTLATGCMIQVHGRDYAGNHVTDQSDDVFTIVGDSLSVSVASGWNLWGVPMSPADASMSENIDEDIEVYW